MDGAGAGPVSRFVAGDAAPLDGFYDLEFALGRGRVVVRDGDLAGASAVDGGADEPEWLFGAEREDVVAGGGQLETGCARTSAAIMAGEGGAIDGTVALLRGCVGDGKCHHGMGGDEGGECGEEEEEEEGRDMPWCCCCCCSGWGEGCEGYHVYSRSQTLIIKYLSVEFLDSRYKFLAEEDSRTNKHSMFVQVEGGKRTCGRKRRRRDSRSRISSKLFHSMLLSSP